MRSIISRWLAASVVATEVLTPRLSFHFIDCSTLALVGLLSVLVINDGDVPLLGLRLKPDRGWWYWCRISLWFFLGIGVILAAFALIWYSLGWTIPIHRTRPSLAAAYWMCIYSPVCEEVIYRALLTVAVLPTFGPRGTILASGLIFALVHVLRGIPSPENQVAGFVLAWAFPRSGTILVPIAMHSAGNCIALVGQIAAWIWTPEGLSIHTTFSAS